MSARMQRLLWLDAQVRERNYPNVADLCEHFGIAERTAFDDIAFLREALHAPLIYRRRYGGYEYASPAWAFPAPFVAPSHAAAWSWLLDELEQAIGRERVGELLAGFVARVQAE
jgi:hypothetical protein